MKDKIDYAPHYLQAKQNLTKMYDLLNKREYTAAAGLIDETIVSLRLMRTAVKNYAE